MYIIFREEWRQDKRLLRNGIQYNADSDTIRIDETMDLRGNFEMLVLQSRGSVCSETGGAMISVFLGDWLNATHLVAIQWHVSRVILRPSLKIQMAYRRQTTRRNNVGDDMDYREHSAEVGNILFRYVSTRSMEMNIERGIETENVRRKYYAIPFSLNSRYIINRM